VRTLTAAWRSAGQTRAAQARARLQEAWAGRLGGSAASAAWTLAPAVTPASVPAPRAATSGGAAPETPEESPEAAAVRQAVNEPSVVVRWWLYLKLLFQRFGRDQCTVYAAALSFFGLVSIAPVLLLALAALGYV